MRVPPATSDFLHWPGIEEATPVVLGNGEHVRSSIDTAEDAEALVAVDRRPLTSEHWNRIEAWPDRCQRGVRGAAARALDGRVRWYAG